MTFEVYMTVKEIAAYLRLNVQTVYRKVGEKGSDALPHVRIGGAIRFKKSDVDNWMIENSKNQ